MAQAIPFSGHYFMLVDYTRGQRQSTFVQQVFGAIHLFDDYKRVGESEALTAYLQFPNTATLIEI